MSDSEEYDSDEERLRGRQQQMQWQRKTRTEAAEQMERLRRFRADQDAARRVAQDAWQANQSASRAPGVSWTPEDSRSNHDTSRLRVNDGKVVDAHERRWVEIDCASAGPETQLALAYDDIPWPPFEPDLNRYLVAMASSQDTQEPGAPRHAAVRKAYTQACLRWHPDKFQHKYYKCIQSNDWDRVFERVHQVSQALNQAWADVQAEEQDGDGAG